MLRDDVFRLVCAEYEGVHILGNLNKNTLFCGPEDFVRLFIPNQKTETRCCHIAVAVAEQIHSRPVLKIDKMNRLMINPGRKGVDLHFRGRAKRAG